jgi:hypothetical protein
MVEAVALTWLQVHLRGNGEASDGLCKVCHIGNRCLLKVLSAPCFNRLLTGSERALPYVEDEHQSLLGASATLHPWARFMATSR